MKKKNTDIINGTNNEYKTHIVKDSENFSTEEENELEIKNDEIKKSDKKIFGASHKHR